MPLIYRPAREEDLQQAAELVVRSMNELSQSHGFGPMAIARPPSFSLFSLRDDPDGLWVAADGDEISGFAFSWVCGDLWFLAQLFVSPGQQGWGIGQQLLKRAFEHAVTAGAETRALITFAFNGVSQGLYMRHGLFPRCPIYNFTVGRDDLVKRLSGEREHLRCVPLERTPSHARRAGENRCSCLGGITREASLFPTRRWRFARLHALRRGRMRRLRLCY